MDSPDSWGGQLTYEGQCGDEAFSTTGVKKAALADKPPLSKVVDYKNQGEAPPFQSLNHGLFG
jgi:hypothetical protein